MGSSWIAFVMPQKIWEASTSNNIQSGGGRFIDFPVSFAESGVLHQNEDKWAENKLNTVKRNAKIDDRPLPKQEVVNRAKALLYSLLQEEIKPKFINPSVDGGIIVEFENKGIYYMTEMDNEDDIIFLIRDEKKTRAFDLNSENYLDQIIDRIRLDE
jgi:hypothetical protein